jgi:hypothetical protein
MAESLEQHYRRLLGLEEPWVVEAVKLELAAQRVEIRLRAQVTTRGFKCPECGEWSALYDHAPERRWRSRYLSTTAQAAPQAQRRYTLTPPWYGICRSAKASLGRHATPFAYDGLSQLPPVTQYGNRLLFRHDPSCTLPR